MATVEEDEELLLLLPLLMLLLLFLLLLLLQPPHYLNWRKLFWPANTHRHNIYTLKRTVRRNIYPDQTHTHTGTTHTQRQLARQAVEAFRHLLCWVIFC